MINREESKLTWTEQAALQCELEVTLCGHQKNIFQVTGGTLDPSTTSRRMKWNYVTAAFLVLFAVAAAEGEIWEEDDHEVLIRSERGAKNRGEPCRYVKGPWTECDPKTTSRTRTLTLKKGDPSQCEPTKTIQKKCKKACRYEKGPWSECNSQGQMVRVDKLKSNSDSSCEQNREITRKCKSKGGKAKTTKGSSYQSNANRKTSSGGSRRNKQ